MRPGKQAVLDIDDTFCTAHGGQQLAFWNAHHDERGFAPMHIYHVASGTPVVGLRPACTPSGTEVCTVIKHVTKRLRRHWPNTRLVWRGAATMAASRRWNGRKATIPTTFLALPGTPPAPLWQRPLATALPSCDEQRAEAAHLCELRLPGRQLEAARKVSPGRVRAAGRERHASGGRHPLRRHLAQGLGTAPYENVYCQRGRWRTDQAAQGAVGVGSNVVPQRDAIRCACSHTAHSG